MVVLIQTPNKTGITWRNGQRARLRRITRNTHNGKNVDENISEKNINFRIRKSMQIKTVCQILTTKYFQNCQPLKNHILCLVTKPTTLPAQNRSKEIWQSCLQIKAVNKLLLFYSHRILQFCSAQPDVPARTPKFDDQLPHTQKTVKWLKTSTCSTEKNREPEHPCKTVEPSLINITVVQVQ